MCMRFWSTIPLHSIAVAVASTAAAARVETVQRVACCFMACSIAAAAATATATTSAAAGRHHGELSHPTCALLDVIDDRVLAHAGGAVDPNNLSAEGHTSALGAATPPSVAFDGAIRSK